MVKNIPEMKRLIETTLYPPLGTRGFGPLRAIGYGALDAKQYAEKESLELCRFVQIEDASLLQDVDALINMPYVDGYIFGPNDLSGSLGEFLNVFGEKTVSCVAKAAKALRSGGKIVAMACGASEAAVSLWSDIGFDIIFAGADWNYVYEMGRSTLALIKKHTIG
jgi:2-dehydro-3-deoxyglucarate aldolase/4-hydroxy-2-oxoheptanedioate aldolase